MPHAHLRGVATGPAGSTSASPAPHRAHAALLALQRSAGNQAVLQLAGGKRDDMGAGIGMAGDIGTAYAEIVKARNDDYDARIKGEDGYKAPSAGDKQGLEIGKRDWDAAASTGDTLSALLLTANAIHQLRQAKNADERFAAIVGTVEGSAKTVGGTMKMAHAAAAIHHKTDQGVGASADVGKFGGGTVGEFVDSAKSLVLTVKQIYDLVTARKTTSAKDKGAGSLKVVMGALQTAKPAVQAAKVIMDSGAPQALKDAVPGLGIAVSGMQIALATYNAVFAFVSRDAMQTEKRGLKSQNQAWFSGFDGKRKLGFISWTAKPGKKEVLAHREKALKGKADADAELVRLTQVPSTRKSVQDRIAAQQKLSADHEADLGKIQEYLLYKELQTINEKRIGRSGIKIGVELTKIAADISSLSGVGATAGIPLKAAAAGVDVGFTAARRLKQMARDYAGSHPGSRIAGLVDTEKTTEKKDAARDAQAQQILSAVGALAPPAAPTRSQLQGEELRISKMVAAAGLDYRLWVLEPDAVKKKEMLVTALKQRE